MVAATDNAVQAEGNDGKKEGTQEMTAEVINIDDYRKHVVSFCECTTCKRKIVSMAPEGTPWPRECDKCQTMTVVEDVISSKSEQEPR